MHPATRRAAILGGRSKIWSPLDLGTALLGFWDAERTDKLTLSGANITTWTDVVGGYAATQSTSGFKPVYSGTSFNGRPGISFDGTDDYLELAAPPFPAGSVGSEIWTLVRQDALAADNTIRASAAYGSSGNTMRYVQRFVTGGVNRAQTRTGDGTSAMFASNTTVDLSGYHLIRGIFSPTTTGIAADGSAISSTAIVPSTTATRLRIGASSSTAAAAWWSGLVNTVIVTALLSDAQAAVLTAYLKLRGGIA